MTPLKELGVGGNLIEVFKLRYGFENVDYSQIFILASTEQHGKQEGTLLNSSDYGIELRKETAGIRLMNYGIHGWSG